MIKRLLSSSLVSLKCFRCYGSFNNILKYKNFDSFLSSNSLMDVNEYMSLISIYENTINISSSFNHRLSSRIKYVAKFRNIGNKRTYRIQTFHGRKYFKNFLKEYFSKENLFLFLNKPWKFYKKRYFLVTSLLILILLLIFFLEEDRLPCSLLSLKRAIRCLYVTLLICLDYKLSYKVHYYFKNRQKEPYKILKRFTDSKKINPRNANRLYNMLVQNGGLFIKFGQFMASMNSVLPDVYLMMMSYCQDSVPFRISNKEAKKIFKAETGKDCDKTFEIFESKPIAAASLGQVFKAKRKDTGEWVAIKILFPDVRKRVKSDILILKLACNLTEFLFPDLRILWLYHQVVKHIPKELDFQWEGVHADLCRRILRRNKLSGCMKVPNIHWDLSSEKILCMDFMEGFKINDIRAIEQELKIHPREVISLLEKFYSVMIYKEGIIHCDPHPGNLKIRINKNTGQLELVILDHNPYVFLSDETRLDFCKFYLASVDHDLKEMKRLARKFGVTNFKLFGSMILSRRWDEIQDSVLRNQKFDKGASEKYFQDHFFEGIRILEKVDKGILLLLKSSDLMRSLHYDLGLYDTGFANYCCAAQIALNEDHVIQMVERGSTVLSRWVSWWIGIWIFIKLWCTLQFYKLYLRWKFD